MKPDMTAAEHLRQCAACNHGRTPCLEYVRTWPVTPKAIVAAVCSQTVAPPPDLLTRLRVVGGTIRQNLKDAVVLHPECFNAEGINQLLAEYDAVNAEVVKFECSSVAPAVSSPPHPLAEAFAWNDGRKALAHSAYLSNLPPGQMTAHSGTINGSVASTPPSSESEDDMNYEVIADQVTRGDWRVEAINHNGEGECFVAIFSGPEAETRAREYAAWKNQ